jgi:hypothetical protein
VVVAVGLTLTPVPLVTGRLPGVITPVPFANTPVRVALDPVVIEVGLAPKLVMEGGGGGGVLDDPLPHPVKLATPRTKRTRRTASGMRTGRRFMGYLVSRSGEARPAACLKPSTVAKEPRRAKAKLTAQFYIRALYFFPRYNPAIPNV